MRRSCLGVGGCYCRICASSSLRPKLFALVALSLLHLHLLASSCGAACCRPRRRRRDRPADDEMTHSLAGQAIAVYAHLSAMGFLPPLDSPLAGAGVGLPTSEGDPTRALRPPATAIAAANEVPGPLSPLPSLPPAQSLTAAEASGWAWIATGREAQDGVRQGGLLIGEIGGGMVTWLISPHMGCDADADRKPRQRARQESATAQQHAAACFFRLVVAAHGRLTRKSGRFDEEFEGADRWGAPEGEGGYRKKRRQPGHQQETREDAAANRWHLARGGPSKPGRDEPSYLRTCEPGLLIGVGMVFFDRHYVLLFS